MKCTAIGPHHGDPCNGGRVQSPNAQFTRDCEVCRGTGEVGDPHCLIQSASEAAAIDGVDAATLPDAELVMAGMLIDGWETAPPLDETDLTNMADMAIRSLFAHPRDVLILIRDLRKSMRDRDSFPIHLFPSGQPPEGGAEGNRYARFHEISNKISKRLVWPDTRNGRAAGFRFRQYIHDILGRSNTLEHWQNVWNTNIIDLLEECISHVNHHSVIFDVLGEVLTTARAS